MEDPSSTKRKSKRSKKNTSAVAEEVGSSSLNGESALAPKDHHSTSSSNTLDQIKSKAQSLVEQTLHRARSDVTFRQKLQLASIIFIVAIIVLAQMMQMSQLGTSRLQRAFGKSLASPNIATKINEKKSSFPEGKTKTQYENEELSFDVSGKDLLSVRRRFASRHENEEAQKNAPKRADKRCLKFPATVSRDSTGLKYYMPKKVFDLPVLQRSLKKHGFELTSDIKEADIILKGVPRVTFRQLKEGKQYYDMVASLSRIGSKKKTQLATLRNHVKKFGCSFESLGVQPRSWDMNKPTDCKNFFQEHEDRGRMIVFKSCNSGEGSKGAGITVTDNLREYREQWDKCEANAFNYVAQHYIEHPMLIKNRKFDMRVYILVASTQPYIVFFNPGYIRRSLAEYKPTSTDKSDVLTNYHVQVTRSDFSPADALWSFSQFIDYLKSEKLCQACGDVEIQLAKIARLVFDAGREYYVRHPGSFQIVGLDFMIDSYLRPMFIEGNVSPGLGSHELKWKKELMDDLIYLMYEQVMIIHERPDEFDLVPGDRVYGPHDNYWQLLVHETLEQCDKKWLFDPCKELTTPWKPWI